MRLHNCKVRLHGDVRDEVRKKNVTSGEIRLLQQIHGEDAVSEIVATGKDANSEIPGHETELRGETEERERLGRIYGELAVAKMFGVKPVSLSAEVDLSVEVTAELSPEDPTFIPLEDRPDGIEKWNQERKRKPGRPSRVNDLVA